MNRTGCGGWLEYSNSVTNSIFHVIANYIANVYLHLRGEKTKPERGTLLFAH